MRERLVGMCAVALLLLAGCGGGDGDPTPDAAATEDLAPSAPDASDEAASEATEATVAADIVPLPEFDPHWPDIGPFAAATRCTVCHTASAPGTSPSVMRDDDGKDISPADGWRHSVMAHAFDDPYFQAVMQDETQVLPHLAGDIEDKCLTCHAPMGRTHAHQSLVGLSQEDCSLANGCYRYEQAVNAHHAREGISCTLCHQVQDDGRLGSVFSGSYTIGSDKKIFGPFPNPVGQAMVNNSGYTPEHAPHMGTSEHCATCHNLRTPTIDVSTGLPTGREFLEQAPYFEWKNSLYYTGQAQARQCQDCHMAEPGEGSYSTRIAVRPDGGVNTNWPERAPFRPHHFVGGNVYLLELLATYRSVLGIENTTTEEGFAEKIAETRAFLANQAAELQLKGLGVRDGDLDVEVVVINNTGHKLPTGFPSRRAWLHLRVTDAAGKTVFESGAPDTRGRISTDAASLAPACLAVEKPAGFANDGCFEPHRDAISDPRQVAIYEAVMGDVNGHVTHVLLHADRYLKDNRLPPRGFLPEGARFEPDTASVGVAGDTNFNAQGSGNDTVRYRIPVGGASGPYTVSARLLYQTIRPSFVAGMHGDGERVQRFKVMYADTPPGAEVLAEARLVQP